MMRRSASRLFHRRSPGPKSKLFPKVALRANSRILRWGGERKNGDCAVRRYQGLDQADGGDQRKLGSFLILFSALYPRIVIFNQLVRDRFDVAGITDVLAQHIATNVGLRLA